MFSTMCTHGERWYQVIRVFKVLQHLRKAATMHVIGRVLYLLVR